MVSPQAVRRWVITGAVTAITVTGSIYGATLRSDQQAHEVKKRVLQATPEERIAQLEVARSELVSRKNELERKLKEVSARRLAKEKGLSQEK
ncbi:uncharacterized protein EI97DRAFT_384696 [Westerdykella ornata]|uniref:Uncharacterized protein n=1 Tax=Westerdykella ornata TaxID=318751 RepID=A0A6A6J9K1_WESOR|nr:uncharacterized protein EI97DRAFT_384696 [Westerdykella ornata]KAF2272894.1 hypothetical protein EI97DRAFT_384696 [Westerdykella ornata]